MKIAITGHRPNKLNNDYDLVSSLVQKIECQVEIELINLGILSIQTGEDTIKRVKHIEGRDDRLITGMALGIDTLFAQIAIRTVTPFIAAIPFKGQELVWPKKSQVLYQHLLLLSNRIVVCHPNRELIRYPEYVSLPSISVTKSLAAQLMQERNIWMVDNCDKLIAVWDGTPGGTKNCYDYAVTKIGKENIIRINPNDFKP